MATEHELEKLIVESVMRELANRGFIASRGAGDNAVPVQDLSNKQDRGSCCITDSQEPLTIPEIDGVWIPEPENLDAVKVMKQTTPARIGLFRAGPRPKTGAYLRFLADHAQAMDAVFMDVSEEFIRRMNLFSVQTQARDKDEFLKRPDLGRKLSEDGVATVLEKCQKDAQVQILVVDGLSSSAIEANVPDVLQVLQHGLQAAGIKVGTPFFIKNGRVGVQDQVGRLLNSDVIISLIGERPGLVTADSMSAYIIYRPNENTVEADRTVFSNIHQGGTPPAEAGAHLVDVLKQILKAKASGMNLNLQ